jgi:UDP-N-acetyl-2-amino-2-deoxyglucuronate dehydrogenase
MRQDKTNEPTFAIIGLGFIANKHIKAIQSIGGKILFICDTNQENIDKVFAAKFYTDWIAMTDDEDFKKVEYVVICTPNNTHFSIATFMVDLGKKVICEKPIAMDTEELTDLFNGSYNENINCVYQMRYQPVLVALKREIENPSIIDPVNPEQFYNIELKMFVHRDEKYFNSWRGRKEKTGGMLLNLGVHYFDILCWLFGKPLSSQVHLLGEKMATGEITFIDARVRWHIGINAPVGSESRYLKVNGMELKLIQEDDNNFIKLYRDILNQRGIKPQDAAEALNLIFKIYEKGSN